MGVRSSPFRGRSCERQAKHVRGVRQSYNVPVHHAPVRITATKHPSHSVLNEQLELPSRGDILHSPIEER
jgi:hypothetical protein